MSTKKIICGFHAINARLWQHPETIKEIYLLESRDDARSLEVVEKAKDTAVKVYRVPPARLNAMVPGQKHQGVTAVVSAAPLYTHIEDVLEDLETPPLLLILDEVTDPHNLGACLRVADAMGVDAVIVPKDHGVGLNATVSKVASGAAETVPLITVTNLARTLRALKERGIWLFGTAGEAQSSLYSTSLPKNLAWVMGSEGKGMRRLTRELCDELVSIPMFGQVSSLNVSVSSGIVLAETRRQYGFPAREEK